VYIKKPRCCCYYCCRFHPLHFSQLHTISEILDSNPFFNILLIFTWLEAKLEIEGTKHVTLAIQNELLAIKCCGYHFVLNKSKELKSMKCVYICSMCLQFVNIFCGFAACIFEVNFKNKNSCHEMQKKCIYFSLQLLNHTGNVSILIFYS
jgi:hypothetical protein